MSLDIKLLSCLSFNTKFGTPAWLREAVALKEDELAVFAEELRGPVSDDFTGLFYLATCHRIELYSFGYKPGEVLQDWSQMKGEAVEKGCLLEGVDALRSLFQVTASLDSEVLGETQVTGQVKEAAQSCRNMGLLKGPLDRFVQQALRVAKRVRNETELGRGTVSVAHVAIDGMDDFFDSFEDKSALLIGAGTMALQALERLVKMGVGRITWVNRSRDKILLHPLNHHCQIADFEKRHLLCLEHEIIVAATSSPEPVLTLFELEGTKTLNRKKHADSHLILDMGLPRNVDEQIHGFKQFYVRNVDEFRDRADENSKNRHKALEPAMRIIQEELAKTVEECTLWDRGPLIGELKSALAQVFEEEIHNLKLEKQKDSLYISRGVQGKLLHKLLKELESLDANEALEILRFLNRAWRRPESWLQKNMDLLQKPPQAKRDQELPL